MTRSPEAPVVMVVDDEPDNVTLLCATLLEAGYQVRPFVNASLAWASAQLEAPDVLLLDILMPGMDGFEFCAAFRANAAFNDIPILFLSGLSDTREKVRAFDTGGSDYITKPFHAVEVLARVKTHLQAKRGADLLKSHNQRLEAEVEVRTQQVTAIQDVTILTLASLAETRDSDTGNHIRRTQHYVRLLASALAGHPHFAWFLSDQMIDLLYRSAPLHDIGKVGIPDRILLKPGRLTPEEFEVMKTHTTLGAEAIAQAERRLGTRVDFLAVAKDIALYHQERWDGAGYPFGASHDDIPIAARLMAVSDVYDALISRRIYRSPTPHDEVIAMIDAEGGKHFDPDVVRAFVDLHQEFKAIADRFADGDRELSAKSASVATVCG